ncbi:hypothetical protein BIV57_06545 [Mangrovactinospora gilvigrisea]|uniref:ADP-ribosylglycohydrolase family protein n=1 Tax=Mangrovactinospora gilvigrisea TaxID=1428644 RepID=A0A1J7C9X2_9ACTN|nr:ADP-ribosylglycohydrolase family protein [Mangrovactinospora gilvigrisea]OIV38316.1 hypothetical protein BIV57_06545 [Mangrovactinospora gilvigrisea]
MAARGEEHKGGRAAEGTLFGLAIGDALGYPTEFSDIAALDGRYGSWRQLPFPVRSSGTALVSDDTQMTLAYGDALRDLLAGGGPLDPARHADAVRTRFVRWLHDPENNRAPGNTCLHACAGLERGGPWQQSSVLGSKGCGANMRVAPIALVPGLSDDDRAGAAQQQAALTHGHPTAIAATELTAAAIRDLADGIAPQGLVDRLVERATRQRSVYRAGWLGDLAERAGAADGPSFMAPGWDECLAVLGRVRAHTDGSAPRDEETDPCALIGAGWIAEEALATALYCFLLFPDDPAAAVRRAAHSSGDSDSIAALAGAFAGARHGAEAWPAEWTDRIEYRDHLAALALAWDV